jgi:hypothetical protein
MPVRLSGTTLTRDITRAIRRRSAATRFRLIAFPRTCLMVAMLLLVVVGTILGAIVTLWLLS